ncbi:MAG: chorismate mutase [Pyrinomonadaceae bacterium]|nr:chorismate mutase [Pyrinomonadaceae bacterium]
MNLNGWRNEIDEIDNEILRLLENRARIVTEIGRAKAAIGLPIVDEQREQAILQRVANATNKTLTAESANCVFQCIITESRRIQTEIIGEIKSQSAEIC